MEKPHSNWKKLPTEILHVILQLAAKDEPIVNTCNYALVCKSWTYLAQFVMYSNVTIHNLSQLKKFHSTVKHNISLGEVVKVFRVHNSSAFIYPNDQDLTNVEMINLVSSLLISSYLPNLQDITDLDLNSYAHVLNALLGSQLKRLKHLPIPNNMLEKNEISNYIKCALLMKERLESVTILSDNRQVEGRRVQKLQYHRLYNLLHQFGKLTKIHVKRETHEEIQAMEYVVETCKSLKNISFVLTPPKSKSNTVRQNSSVSIDEISSFKPTFDIKELNCYLYMSNDHKTIIYIMHKFQQVQEFNLKMTENNVDKLNQCVLSRLLHYLSGINRYTAFGLAVDPITSTETVGSYWDATSKPGNEYVKISYHHWYDEAQTELDLSKSDRHGTFTGLNYSLKHLENMEWVHKGFIEQNGAYIHKLLFTIDDRNMHSPDTWGLLENFFAHTFSFCPNLQYLHLFKCTLKKSTYSTVDLSKKFSLTELFLAHCNVYQGMLEQLSLLLCKVKQLRLGMIWYFLEEQQDQFFGGRRSCYDISMPHTEIDVILFEARPNNFYLRLFVQDQESYYHYHLNPKEYTFDLVGEEEYLKGLNQGNYINICCKNKPELRVGPATYFGL